MEDLTVFCFYNLPGSISMVISAFGSIINTCRMASIILASVDMGAKLGVPPPK
jgi:hypothetical protein